MRGAAPARRPIPSGRWLGLVWACALGGAVVAQGVRSVGTTSAEVLLEVAVDLGSVLQLTLGADTVTFDLGRLGDPDGAVCVVGDGADVRTGVGPDGGDAVAPAGTWLTVGAWPTLVAFGARTLGAYPPSPDEAAGGVVCYRTFTLGAYANVGAWHLVVDRDDVADGAPFPALYVGSACPDEPVAGLLPLANGERRTVRVGSTAAVCAEMVVAVAVRVEGGLAGTARTDLRYTLLAADADFATE